jgi:intergrase/recombinase
LNPRPQPINLSLYKLHHLQRVNNSHTYYDDLFPQFLRQTQKCYVSFITPEISDLVKGSVNLPTLTYEKIRLTCWKQGITCDLRFARKIFASHLRHSGIAPEVVNLLQGRVDSDILTRHYLVPRDSLKHQVIDALKQLQKMID